LNPTEKFDIMRWECLAIIGAGLILVGMFGIVRNMFRNRKKK
jgi:hypothetical protein